MEFCPECGSLMYPTDGKFECRDCETIIVGEEKEVTVTEQAGKEGEAIVVEGEEGRSLPTTEAKCPECGNNEAYWYMQQTRSADESETRFYICTECDKKWRGYD